MTCPFSKQTKNIYTEIQQRESNKDSIEEERSQKIDNIEKGYFRPISSCFDL